MRLDPNDPLSEVFTIDEAAALPNVNKAPATLRWWIHKGYLKPLRIPGSRRVWVTEQAVLDAERETWERNTRSA
ncbi:hypothetical protein [Actinoallomurus sp. CA-142502]|uniref:hypothetical protein n=1 Tax=Actinoallomurus sp. CA-142502 TaxID=3239885 RepID=UPI003D94BDE3